MKNECANCGAELTDEMLEEAQQAVNETGFEQSADGPWCADCIRALMEEEEEEEEGEENEDDDEDSVS